MCEQFERAHHAVWALRVCCVLGFLGGAGHLASGCAPASGNEKRTEISVEELTLGEGASGGACSTSIVRGLTEQLVQEVDCIVPGAYRSIAGIPNVRLGSAVEAAPYLHRDAAEALRQAAARSGGPIHLNSALRTLPQQYLLYKWRERGRCGIRAAARPGRSNHESGLAIDVRNASSHISRLRPEGFTHAGSSDPPHFDFRGGMDLRSATTRAFQRLWNRNNPRDRIAEDGVYGPRTEARLRRSPADGFPIGATCGVAPTPMPVPTPDAGVPDVGAMGDPDAAVDPDLPAPVGSVCDRGIACADCNAIATECGFCATSGRCMEGNAAGPLAGSCGGGWQWMAPSLCPMEPDPDPDPDPIPDPDPPATDPTPTPAPMCVPVRSELCASTAASCCDGLSCRRGVSYPTRCCADGGQRCGSGGDCCGYMDCVSGMCACRGAGRACLGGGDCCSGTCRSGRCR